MKNTNVRDLYIGQVLSSKTAETATVVLLASPLFAVA
jgi:hypothetical protein